MRKLFASSKRHDCFTSPKDKLAYQPITDPNGIRLVHILPGSRLSAVKCELQQVALGPETPEYVALSYCWGDAKQKTWVNCDGQGLTLTQDFLNALRNFRHKENIMTFWIDQICINQENLDERSSQVQHMKEIYTNATQVYIWLGEEADRSEVALKLILRILKSAAPPKESAEVPARELGFPLFNAKEWRALSALLFRPWFGRMWIIQEAIPNPNALMFCGQHSVSLGDFFMCIERLVENDMWSYVQNYEKFAMTRLVSSRTGYLMKIKKQYLQKKSLALLDILRYSRPFESTDPRDKIYALLGLCSESLIIQPDYSKDVIEVYRELAVSFLFPSSIKRPALRLYEYSFTELLQEAERQTNVFALPSWVPDWKGRDNFALSSKTLNMGYRAAGNSKAEVTLTKNANEIAISGKLCDSVRLMSSSAHNPIAQHAAQPMKNNATMEQAGFVQRVPLAFWIYETSAMAANCGRYPDPGSLDIAYRQTLIGNAASDSNNDYAKYYWDFRQFLTKLCPNGVVNGAPFPVLKLILGQHYENFHWFENALVNVADDRRFFTTVSGYMGLGPPGMRTGDKICIFLGVEVPWVVRRDGEKYTLVGECYVHGIMDGEVIRAEYLKTRHIIIK